MPVLSIISPLSDQMTNAVIFKYRTRFWKVKQNYCKWKVLVMMMMIIIIIIIIIIFQINILLCITG